MPLIDPNPTLVIGLGGTGQWVTTHILKELMELYGKQEPGELSSKVRILAIDTDLVNRATIGVENELRTTGTQTGQIVLPNDMLVPLGENVHSYVKQIAGDLHPHISSWFDAKWFLGKPNHPVLLNLTQGARAYRPLGRLAVPYNLNQASVPTLRRALQDRIEKIKEAMGGFIPDLTVCIAGSLCGGTGAGLIVDVAYLVKKLADPIPVKIIGYLALPQAFDHTVPMNEADQRAIRRRAFAAMRELRRFARGVRYELNYPICYAGADRGDDKILRGYLNETLFDLLYYFDKTMTRPEQDHYGKITQKPVPLELGVAPLIAEGMLVWIDGETSKTALSHGANHSQKKDDLVTAGHLDTNAAVAGGLGAYTLQLPIHHIIEGWTHKLGHRALQDFLGIHPENGEDATTKTGKNLRDDWAGGESSQSGLSAARTAWTGGQVGGVGVTGLIYDHFESGAALRLEGDQAVRRQTELSQRSGRDWEQFLEPPEKETEEERILRTMFLSPAEEILERGGFLGLKKTRVRSAEVRTSSQVEGDERKNPKIGAQRVDRDVNDFFQSHLGKPDHKTGARGGSDRNPEGAYPKMLQRWAEKYVKKFRDDILENWVAEVLNGVTDKNRTPGEMSDSGRLHRAGKLGHLRALLKELANMLHETEKALRDQEKTRLGIVLSARNSQRLQNLKEDMRKNHKNQNKYLEEQQKILEMEHAYAVVRAVRWAAGEMHAFVRTAQTDVEKWVKALAEDLYQSVWSGQDQVQSNRTQLQKLGGVREVVEVPGLEDKRYNYYLERSGGVGSILNDLRWQVVTTQKYNSVKDAQEPVLSLGLKLGEDTLSVANLDTNIKTYLNRCRQVFQDARNSEILLEWLIELDKNNMPGWRIADLAERLSSRGQPVLRYRGAQPYKVGYVRAWKKDDGVYGNYLNRLLQQLETLIGIDQVQSTVVSSSDPYRLTFLAFDELIDVEKLTAYGEGLEGYLALPAKTDPADEGTSRQVLHIFPAEHNAAEYEVQLGKLLPDKVVSLLEDPARFRLFLLAWAYGQEAILIHRHRIPDKEIKNAGKWVYRLTTGPFGEIDPLTQRPKPAEHRWLTEPADNPSLFRAAETFLVSQLDRWQMPGQSLSIVDDRVKLEVERQQQESTKRSDIGRENPSLKNKVSKISDDNTKAAAQIKLADYEHLQKLSECIGDEIIPPLRQAGLVLDADLYEVMRLFIAKELVSRNKEIDSLSGGNASFL